MFSSTMPVSLAQSTTLHGILMTVRPFLNQVAIVPTDELSAADAVEKGLWESINEYVTTSI